VLKLACLSLRKAPKKLAAAGRGFIRQTSLTSSKLIS
jgi:hypothetical protein